MNYMDQYPTTWHMSHTFLLCEVGSTAHGTGLPGKEDHDEMGICFVPPEYMFGTQQFETLVWRPGRSEGEPSGPDDLDLTVYSLHKWMRLAMGGNPSILALLWAPAIHSTPVGRDLRDNIAPLIVSQKAISSYQGYMQNQLVRLETGRGKHGPYRADLIEKYGYDTKYAMHAIRLGLQGLELVETGKIEYPAKDREYLFSVRSGAYTKDEVLAVISDLDIKLGKVKEDNTLQPEPCRDDIDTWMENVYFEFYRKEYF